MQRLERSVVNMYDVEHVLGAGAAGATIGRNVAVGSTHRESTEEVARHRPELPLDPIMHRAIPEPGKPWMMALYDDRQVWGVYLHHALDWKGGGTIRNRWYQSRVTIQSNHPNWSPLLAFGNPSDPTQPWEIRAKGEWFKDCVQNRTTAASNERIPLRHHTIDDPTGYPTNGETMFNPSTGGPLWWIDRHQFWHVFGGRWVDFCMWDDNAGEANGKGWGHNPLYRVSFEDTDRYTTYRDIVEWIEGVTGYYDHISPECSPRLIQSDGAGYPPHVGPTALMYSGRARGSSECNCYFLIFRWPEGGQNPPPIQSWEDYGDSLLYWIMPTEPLGRFVGVDLVCTDGTTLSNSGAVDHRGYSMHPAAGHGGGLPLGQWTQIRCPIYKWLAGKRIERVAVAFDKPNADGRFRGYIDDICITGELRGA